MDISGKTRIYTKDFNGKKLYSTGISRKEQDGTYKNMYVSVQFRQGVEIEDKTDINIINGFLSFYETKEGLSKVKKVVLDFECENKKEIFEVNQITDNAIFTNDELPF